jgi:hypothetical protein
VNFNTSKPVWKTAADKCHLNYVVTDSDWEAEFCRVAEKHPRVLADVKNQGLGLEVPYLLAGEPRRYRIVKGHDRRGKRVLVAWRDMTDLDPKAERDFLEARLKREEAFDRRLINGDSATPGFESLDGLFKQLMTD